MALLTLDAVADLAWRAGFRGESLVTALAVQTAENGTHDTDRVNTAGNKPPSRDRGLWQINDHFHPEVTDAVAFDGAGNAREAYRISKGGTAWGAWSTFNGGQYRTHLDAARAAATAAEGRKGGTSGQTTGAAATTTAATAATTATRPPVDIPYGSGLDTLNLDSRPMTLADLTMLGMQGGAVGGIRERILSATLDLSLQEVSQLTVVIHDPGLYAFLVGSIMPGLQVDLEDLIATVTAVEIGQGAAGEQLTVTAQDSAAEYVKRNRNQGPTGMMDPASLARDIVPPPISWVIESDNPQVDTTKQADSQDPLKRLETDWDRQQRYAKDLGYVFSVVGGIGYFARPTFITAGTPGFVVKWRPGRPYQPGEADYPFAPLECPTVRIVDNTSDVGNTGEVIPHAGADAPVTVSVKLPAARAARIRPGFRLELYGMGPFDGPYMVTKVHGDLVGDMGAWTVEAATPIDPTPANAAAAAAAAGGAPTTSTPSGKGTKLASDFVALAMSMAGHQYVYGATPSLTNASPGAFDCSSLVQWAAAQAGVSMPRTSGQQYAACAKRATTLAVDDAIHTRGALLFRGHLGADHVAISLGDGKSTIEARGKAYGVLVSPVTGRQWDNAGLVPDLDYSGVLAASQWKFGRRSVG